MEHLKIPLPMVNQPSQPPQGETTARTTEIALSVIIPAFNEEARLAPMLTDCLQYLESQRQRFEVIVVDDGSTDDTLGVVEQFHNLHPSIRSMSLKRNVGKGYAVKSGMLAASGGLILFADADGSTPFVELDRLLRAIDSGADVAIGSRAMVSPDTSIRTKWYRKYLGRMFNACVNALTLPGIADTQCGFKLFRKEAARAIFSQQTSERFSFDVEILFIARKLGFTISEIPINWTNVPGSKVNLLADSIDMLKDVARFRWIHRSLAPLKQR